MAKNIFIVLKKNIAESFFYSLLLPIFVSQLKQNKLFKIFKPYFYEKFI